MTSTLTAIFERGAFRPESPCDLAEGSRVILDIHDAGPVQPPVVAAPAERERILRELLARMKANPLLPGAPRFTRDELHDRS